MGRLSTTESTHLPTFKRGAEAAGSIRAFNIVLTLPVARGLPHDLVFSRTKRINCGNIS